MNDMWKNEEIATTFFKNLNKKKETHIFRTIFVATFRATVNPKKAGGSESMYSLGGTSHASPPLEKGLRE